MPLQKYKYVTRRVTLTETAIDLPVVNTAPLEVAIRPAVADTVLFKGEGDFVNIGSGFVFEYGYLPTVRAVSGTAVCDFIIKELV